MSGLDAARPDANPVVEISRAQLDAVELKHASEQVRGLVLAIPLTI
jgi:hypothetical protein